MESSDNGLSRRVLAQRVAILERDRDRLALLMSLTQQMLQNIIALVPDLSSISCNVSSSLRPDVKGEYRSIYACNPESFPYVDLFDLMQRNLQGRKS